MRAPSYSRRDDEVFSAETIENPQPLYARLRREHPISRIAETGVHLVATRDLIEEALEREADFSANLTGVLLRGEDGRPSVLELPSSPASRVIATADEPAHAVHRSVVQPRLAPSRIAALESALRRWAHAAIDAWIETGAGDFVPIAERVPARVLAELLGLPDGDVSRHRTWAMMGGDILAGDLDRERWAHLARETAAMREYLLAHLEKARADTRPEVDAPLLHSLARGVHSRDIEVEEAVGIATVMFGAGGESTAALLGSVVRRLSEEDELVDRLRDDLALVPAFVEEVARLEPPFNFHYRVVRRPCALGGADLQPGDRLMLLWASANRDETRIEAPDELRLDRRHPRDHLAFGRGAHFCIGANLARLEARVVCEDLLARDQRLVPSPDAKPEYARSIFVRRLERLPLIVGRTP